MKANKLFVVFFAVLALLLTSCTSSLVGGEQSPEPTSASPEPVRWKPIAKADQVTKIVTEQFRVSVDDGEECELRTGGLLTFVASRLNPPKDGPPVPDKAVYTVEPIELDPYTPQPNYCEDGATVLVSTNTANLEEIGEYERHNAQSIEAYERPVKNPVTHMVGEDLSLFGEDESLTVAASDTTRIALIGRCKVEFGDRLTSVASSRAGDVMVVRYDGGDCAAHTEVLISTDVFNALDGVYERVMNEARQNFDTMTAPILVTKARAVTADPLNPGRKCFLQVNGVVEVSVVDSTDLQVIHYLAPEEVVTPKPCEDGLVTILRGSDKFDPSSEDSTSSAPRQRGR